jgi:hypothetical protein
MDLALTQSTLFSADRRRAVLVLSLGALGGGVTQALFWRTTLGLNFWVWDVCAVVTSVLVFQRGSLRATAWGAMLACVALGFFLVRYESAWTLSIAFPSTLVLLAALPLLLSDRPGLADLSGVPTRMVAALGRAPSAVVETGRLPGVAFAGAPPGLLKAVARGLFVGLPTASVFTFLLASDTDFARSLVRARGQLGDTALFAGWSALTAAAYVVAHFLHAGRAEARDAALSDRPYRTTSLGRAVTAITRRPSVSVVTWAMVIGQVTLVFALFVAANVRHLFGGSALVRAPGSLTYARYLHAGFYEVLFATMLSVCLVVVGHRLLRSPGDRASSAPVPGGRVLSSLEGALLVLTGITVASCWQRLGVYEDAYGASHLRLGVAFIEVAILGIVLLTLGKVVMRRWTGHAGAVLAFGVAIAVVASGFDADSYVARTNLDRASHGKPLDVAYLTSLSGDARHLLDHPFVAAHPELAARLEASFCAPRASSWRSFRGLGRCER